jgi:cytochrome P450
MTSQAELNVRPAIAGERHDISARAFWMQDFWTRQEIFADFRRDCPVSWHRPYESTLQPPDEDTPGFWSIWRNEDIRFVSRNPELFDSGRGIGMESFPEVVAQATQSFLCQDDPEHAQLRNLVSQAFTPGRVRKIEQWIAQEVSTAVDDVIGLGEADVSEALAKQIPGRIFADFFGLTDESQRTMVMDASEALLAWDDPEVAQGRSGIEVYGEEAQKLLDLCYELIPLRQANPGEDLLSWLVQAELEGRRLEDWEIGAFFVLLASAGNDTTRHSIGHALTFFTKFDDQRQLLLEDLPGRLDGAVEEVLRYASPVQQFRRNATQDVEIRGQQIRKDDRVVIWYSSGSFDEAVIADPMSFDILREDNKHLAFGGGGPHFCLGAALARRMIKHALHEVYTRMPDITTGTPKYQINNFIHGVHHIPATWTTPKAT